MTPAKSQQDATAAVIIDRQLETVTHRVREAASRKCATRLSLLAQSPDRSGFAVGHATIER
jgi:hypothetical protein